MRRSIRLVENRYPGKCRVCRVAVPALLGFVEREEKTLKWVCVCPEHVKGLEFVSGSKKRELEQKRPASLRKGW